MPVGAPDHCFLTGYPIRVDAFATPNDPSFAPPLLHLLTHTHTDHLDGLNSSSFGGQIICSQVAKDMLLRHERVADRVEFDRGISSSRKRPYAHLRVEAMVMDGKKISRYTKDLLKPIPLQQPTAVELSHSMKVRITAIDANHCPGAVMFLVEGPAGAVLHTGDVRAERVFLESLKGNPALQRYIPHPAAPWPAPPTAPVQTLEAIHIDTAHLFITSNLLSKEDAVEGLLTLMALFDPETTFLMNTWCWGYEDIIKGVAKRFGSRVHVDRYKDEIYRHSRDPTLLQSITRAEETRFHACEPTNRCGTIVSNAGNVVYVNPVEMSIEHWELYMAETMQSLLNGERLTNLLVPFSRHSGVQELQDLVALFKPKKSDSQRLNVMVLWARMDLFSSHVWSLSRSRRRRTCPRSNSQSSATDRPYTRSSGRKNA